MTISKEVLETSITALEVLIKKGDKSLERIRENEEYERRVPFARITFADPAVQAQSERDAIQHERDIRERIASRKLAVKALKSALKSKETTA